MEPKPESQDPQYDEELLLKWDDHHKSFFELAEDLCHQVLTPSEYHPSSLFDKKYIEIAVYR